MLINISKKTDQKALCRITVNTFTNIKPSRVLLQFNKDAIIGFATELIRLYDCVDEKQKITIETHQLGVDPAPNQALGFFLTSESPVFMLKLNTIQSILSHEDIECISCEDIRIKNKCGNYYALIDTDESDAEKVVIDHYQLSLENVARIRVFDEHDNDISRDSSALRFEINYAGIIGFATMLLIWADNIDKNEYPLVKMQSKEKGYDFGILLTEDSVKTSFQCADLGSAYDYGFRCE